MGTCPDTDIDPENLYFYTKKTIQRNLKIGFGKFQLHEP